MHAFYSSRFISIGKFYSIVSVSQCQFKSCGCVFIVWEKENVDCLRGENVCVYERELI